MTLWTNCPWIQELGSKLDPGKASQLRKLQRERKVRIVRRYKD